MNRIVQGTVWICWCILAGLLIATANGAVPENATPARVRRVLSGDTIVVQMDGDTETIRLRGIDAPEVAGNDGQKENDPSAFGLDATRKMRQALRHKANTAGKFLAHQLRKQNAVMVQTTGKESDRLVGYVFLKKGLPTLGRRIVRAGYARVDTGQYDFQREAGYLRAQVQAMAQRRGVWSLLKHCQSPPTFFIGVHGNTSGTERLNLNDEYVLIGNISGNQHDLSDHRLTDNNNHDFMLPDGTALNPGESLVVRTGSGKDKRLELHRNMDGPVWNNEGDTVYLLDPEGTEIMKMNFGAPKVRNDEDTRVRKPTSSSPHK